MRAPLTDSERRAALIAALESRPEAWVARELAETLARAEYQRGRVDATRDAVNVRRSLFARLDDAARRGARADGMPWGRVHGH